MNKSVIIVAFIVYTAICMVLYYDVHESTSPTINEPFIMYNIIEYGDPIKCIDNNGTVVYIPNNAIDNVDFAIIPDENPSRVVVVWHHGIIKGDYPYYLGIYVNESMFWDD